MYHLDEYISQKCEELTECDCIYKYTALTFKKITELQNEVDQS